MLQKLFQFQIGLFIACVILDCIITMAPKSSSPAGYVNPDLDENQTEETEENTAVNPQPAQEIDILEQIIQAENLEIVQQTVAGSSSDTLDDLTDRLQALTLDYTKKVNALKDEQKARAKAKSKAAAKAKATAKALASAQALAEKKEGMITITAMTMPDGKVVRFNIAKGKTIGKVRSRILRLTGSFPTVGKKNGILKRDILIVDERGNIVADRKYLYNVEGLVNGGRFVAIQRRNFDPNNFVFPVFPDDNADEEEQIDDDDEDDDSEDED